jgi:hypothetical protein
MAAPDTMSPKSRTSGWIVAWRHRWKHEAGKLLDAEMSFEEAEKKASELQSNDADKIYWAELKPQQYP